MPQNTTKPHVKYIHCRNSKDGEIQPHGGLTIAYVLNESFKVVGWAAAKCCNKDNFNKHVGRMKAAGRLLSATYYQECPEIDEKEFVKDSQEGYQKAFNS